MRVNGDLRQLHERAEIYWMTTQNVFNSLLCKAMRCTGLIGQSQLCTEYSLRFDSPRLDVATVERIAVRVSSNGDVIKVINLPCVKYQLNLSQFN